MPSHNHAVVTNNAGSHQHFIASTAKEGSSNKTSTLSSSNYLIREAYGSGFYEDYIFRGQTRNATVGLTSSSGANAHIITIATTGSGKAHQNMPPYFVAYIWKRIA